jgi:WG containing repeat
MKRFLFLSFCTFWQVHCLVAQTTSDHLYLSGALKIRYHIQKKDTIYTEFFFENGKRYRTVWRDSVHYFHPNQTISQVRFGDRPPLTDWLHLFQEDRYSVPAMVETNFYPDGKLGNMYWWNGDTLLQRIHLAPNGQLIHTEKYRKVSKFRYNYAKISKNSSQYWAINLDSNTSVRTYYVNQAVSKIRYARLDKDWREVKVESVEPNGQKRVIWEEDSLRFNVDKDNHLCLYGFRNAKDEWAILPKYEVIVKLNQERYIAVEQGKYGLLDAYGQIIVPFEWDDLALLDSTALFFHPFAKEDLQPNIQLRCRKGRFCGVMDAFGKMMIEPMYQDVRQYKDGLYEVKQGRYWGLVRADGKMVVAPTYVKIFFTPFPNWFVTTDTIRVYNKVDKSYDTHNLYGVVNAEGKTLLPRRFNNLAINAAFEKSFWVTTNSENPKMGLFHAEKGWLIDTIHFGSFNNAMFCEEHYATPMLWRSDDTASYGLWDGATLSMLLPFEYQKIELITNYIYNPTALEQPYQQDTFFHCKQHNQYGLFDPKQRKWVLPVQYDDLKQLDDSVFMASSNGKYQFINLRGQVLLPDTFESVGAFTGYSEFEWKKYSILFGVRHDSAFFYSLHSFPRPMHPQDALKNIDLDTVFQRYVLRTDNDSNDRETVWYFAPNGKVLLSPNQQLIRTCEDYTLVRDIRTNQQQVVDKQGNKKPFFPTFEVKDLSIPKNWAIVVDTVTNGFGMMTLDGKTILPNHFTAMKGMDAQSVIWARRDLSAQKDGMHTDSNWQMYNRKGQLLSKTIFERPFDWSNHLGIGRVNEKEGLWNAQGQNILPAQYDKIWYDSTQQIFHLFVRNKTAQQVGFANAEGQLVIDMSLKNMSFFKNGYAFVETAKGIGLIQKNGSYQVAPQPNAFQKTGTSIATWMPAAFDTLFRSWRTDLFPPLYTQNRLVNSLLDTFKDASERLKAENLLLEQQLPDFYLKYGVLNKMPCTNWYFFDSEYDVIKETSEGRFWGYNQGAADIRITPTTMSWTTAVEDTNISWRYFVSVFKNVRLQNNIWEDTPLEALLNWDRATQTALNQLLIQKISALKNEHMDCSNPQMYLSLVKNHFFILDDGLQFWMPRYPKNSFTQLSNSVPILMTWAELKPFLKD